MKLNIEVRPLKRGEELLWVSIGVEETQKDSRSQRLAEYLKENKDLPAENYLIAMINGDLIGKMTGVRESTGYMAMRMYIRTGAAQEEIARALFSSVKSFGRLQALSWEREDDRDWREILRFSGFTMQQDKVYFRKKVEGFFSPYADNFRYRSLKEIGPSELLDIHRQTYEGNLNQNFNMDDPDSDFRRYIEIADSLFDSGNWYAIFEGVKPIGFIFPQRFPDVPHEGTLMSMGIIPEFRGKGLGKILHAKGLEILSSQGATDYIGSTDVRNTAMIKVFEANGCEQIGIRTTHQYSENK